MSKYTPLEVLQHIRDEAGFLQHLGSSRTWEAFFADPVARRAAVRAIEVVGEATKKLPPDLRARYPEVPWSRMARMRDRMIHDYIDVDYGFVWDVCLRDAARSSRRWTPSWPPRRRVTADPHVSSSRERKARRGPTTSPAGPGLVVRKANPSGLGFCDACFSGHYPVPVDAGVTREEYDA